MEPELSTISIIFDLTEVVRNKGAWATVPEIAGVAKTRSNRAKGFLVIFLIAVFLNVLVHHPRKIS
jgi:hypothetical protein